MAALVAGSLAASAAAGDWREGSKPPKTYAKPLPGDPLGVTVHRLDNGLMVYLSENPELPEISTLIAIRAGGRDDPRDATGMAHYLEHMMFKGSENLGTTSFKRENKHLLRIEGLYESLFRETDEEKRRKLYRRIDKENQKAFRYGLPKEYKKVHVESGFTRTNAFTSWDYTGYKVDIPSHRLETWAKIEADRFARPVFRGFINEIEAVYEERNLKADRPDRALLSAMRKGVLAGTPYEEAVLGRVEHLKNPSFEKIRDYFETYYVPNNMGIFLSGNFERETALAVIERHFGAWEPKPLPKRDFRESGPLPESKVREIFHPSEEMVLLAWRLPGARDPDWGAIRAIDGLLDGTGGILSLALVQDQKLKGAASAAWDMEAGGVFMLFGTPKDGQSVEEVKTLLLEGLDTLKGGRFEEEELRAVVTGLEVDQKEALESNGGRARRMAESFWDYRDWADEKTRLERISSLRKRDVVAVAKKLLDQPFLTVYRRDGKSEVAALDKPNLTPIQIDAESQSEFAKSLLAGLEASPDPRWLQEGKDYEIFQGDWGALYRARNPVSDLFSVQLVFEKGYRHDPELRLAAKVWNRSGVDGMDGKSLKKKLATLGAEMHAQSGSRDFVFTVKGIERHRQETLALFRARLEHPGLDAGLFPRIVEVERSSRRKAKSETASVFKALKGFALKGGDSQFFKNISNERLGTIEEKDFPRKWKEFASMKRSIRYVGNEIPAKIVENLGLNKGDFRSPPSGPNLKFAPKPQTEILFVHRPMEQAQIGIGIPDGVWDKEGWADYAFFDDYFAGGSHAVVFQEIRDSRSLSYNPRGDYSQGPRQGDENLLYGQVYTQADKAPEAATVLLDLMRNLPFSEDRFKTTQSNLFEGLTSRGIRFRGIPRLVHYWKRRGWETDPRPQRLNRARAYSLENLKRFAARFKKRPATLFILGDRERIDLDGLKKLGNIQELTVDDLFPY